MVAVNVCVDAVYSSCIANVGDSVDLKGILLHFLTIFRPSLSGAMLNTAFDNLLQQNFTVAQMARTTATQSVTNCGMKKYRSDINTCPFQPYGALYPVMFINSRGPNEIPNSSYPYIDSLLDRTNVNSFLNLEYGLPKYVGLAYYLGVVDFNSKLGYTMVNNTQFEDMLDEMAYNLGSTYFQTTELTLNQTTGSKRIISGLVRYIATTFI